MRYLTKVFLEHFAFGLTIPFSVMWMLERGLSLTEVGIVQAVIFFSTFLLEVPTGIVADRYGRKLSIASGIGLHVIGLALFTLSPNLLAFLVSAFFTGAAWALISGAEESYVHDVIALQEKNTYKKMFARVTMADEVSTIVGMLLGTLLVSTVSLQAPFIGAVLLMAVTGIFFVLALPKDTKEVDESDVVIESPGNLSTSIKKYQPFLPSFIALAVLFESARILWQPALVQQGWQIAQLGLLFAGLKIFSVLGSFIAERITLTPKVGLIVSGLIGGAALLGLSTTHLWLGLAGLSIYFMMENILRVNQSAFLLEIAPRKNEKTTFLSGASLLRNLFSSLAAPVLGFAATNSMTLVLLGLFSTKLIASYILQKKDAR